MFQIWFKVLFLSVLTAGSFLKADFVEKSVAYSYNGSDFVGNLVYHSSLEGKTVPGILLVPNWMGVTEGALEKAKKVAASDFVVFVADMYGAGVRPDNAEEAGEAAGAVRADRAVMRQRALLALETFLQQKAPLNKERLAAIGFCFGGGTVLEFGRSGAELDAIVSFHGDLLSPTLEGEADKNKAHLLVLHGADDPFVPQEDVAAFVEAMQATKVDWQLVQYANTVHSFTDPNAAMEGKAEFNEQSAERAFAAMRHLFAEVWELSE